jgi:polar amino acid transport system ATP-binding protein
VRYYNNGKNILNASVSIEKIRQEVGMVFQKFNLFPLKTVLENVTMAPNFNKEDKKGKGK